ncbi:putative oligopeptide transporter [Melampsora larici-populina 98AG31]|uniref:Putative oligopeptide transporter n=1 Tax=Melampsora larici-populina (strain 98AG31 / pathotype 3-4-7) TaxID=747676 RepID=F4RIP8_MELLP|nr:putative oligopeptide transporter [Melampsora larici-populina 98AG31]EGG07795.1 putative oligopeptide transporter [Melampsora larici-populina 98AG31]
MTSISQHHSTTTTTTATMDQETEPDFTFRSVGVGLSIGLVLAFTNMYFGLQTGWISMMSLQSSLLGYAIFKVIPGRFLSRPLSIKENVLLQTTATAMGTMPLSAGLVGIIPALSQLSLKLDGSEPIILSPISLIGWCLAVAFFGVYLAIPLRKQVIIKEQLAFPSGIATAQVLSVLHDLPSPNLLKRSRFRSDESVNSPSRTEYIPLPTSLNEIEDQDSLSKSNTTPIDLDHPELKKSKLAQWKALIISFSASITYTLLSLAFPVLYAIPIFDVFGPVAHTWLWWFTPSFAFVGQGIIMGFHTVYSMNLGMIVSWAILSPLAKNQGWAPGEVGNSENGSKGWILWPALSIMMVESIVSLSSVILTYVIQQKLKYQRTSTRSVRRPSLTPRQSSIDSLSTVSSHRDEIGTSSNDDDHVDDEDTVEMKWMLCGFLTSCLVCIGFMFLIFGTHRTEGIQWWATLIALGLASLFSLLGVRALGETDLNPVSAIGKISQLIFGLIQPNNIVANLIAGGISEAGAMQCGEIMQDFKTGYLHHVSPKSMFYGQMIGSFVSVFVSSGVYLIYSKTFTLPSTSFPVPTAAVWLSLARLVNNGELPPKSKETMIVFGIVFFGVSTLRLLSSSETLLNRHHRSKLSWTQYLPSGIAFSVGFINTPSFSISRMIGGTIIYFVNRNQSLKHQESIKIRWIIIGSGFVLGEGIGSILGLGLKSFGFGPVSCWGCGLGGGGYCGGC